MGSSIAWARLIVVAFNDVDRAGSLELCYGVTCSASQSSQTPEASHPISRDRSSGNSQGSILAQEGRGRVMLEELQIYMHRPHRVERGADPHTLRWKDRLNVTATEKYSHRTERKASVLVSMKTTRHVHYPRYTVRHGCAEDIRSDTKLTKAACLWEVRHRSWYNSCSVRSMQYVYFERKEVLHAAGGWCLPPAQSRSLFLLAISSVWGGH